MPNFHKFTFQFPALGKNNMVDAQIFVVGVQPITLNTGYRNERHLLESLLCSVQQK
jgi:hypothetical protein